MDENEDLFPEDESPDKDGSLEGGSDDQGEGPVTEEPAGDQGGGGEAAESDPVKDLMVKKGFKSVKDMVDSYAKLESSNTELRNRVERLSYQPMPGPAVQMPPRPRMKLPDDPVELVRSKEVLGEFVDGLKQDIHEEIASKDFQQKVRKGQIQMNRKMTEVGGERWNQLKPYMLTIADQFGSHPDVDIDWIYSEAEKLEKQSKQRFREAVGLEEGDIELLRNLKSRMKPAPISGGNAPPSAARPSVTAGSSPKDKAAQLISNILNANSMSED